MDSEPEQELYNLLQESIESALKRESSAFDEATKPFENSIVLFGAGGLGRNISGLLRKKGIEIRAFCDNDSSKWGNSVDGIKIVSPDEAAKKYSATACFVITIFTLDGFHYNEIKQNLIRLGCSRVVSYIPLFWKYPDIFPPDVFFSLPHQSLLHREKIVESFKLLGNEESRRQYVSQIRFRLFGDFNVLPLPTPEDHYFSPNIVYLSEEEVLVDCGAYVGDTIKNFLELTRFNFRKIVAYEPDPFNFTELCRYVNTLPDNIRQKISVRKCATGASRGESRFTAGASESSAVCETGSINVACVSLDDELMHEKPSFIKLDVEGAEEGTLIGAREIISAYKPILAVSAYHQPNDIWDIGLLLSSLCGRDYSFFFVTHGGGGIEIVIYAIPYYRVFKESII